MKCTICLQRKGKRLCPAENAMICAPCCGKHRVLQIDCLESCEYLKVGRAQESEMAAELFFRTSNQAEYDKRMRVLDRWEVAMSDMQDVIVAERRSNRDLTDADAAEAFDCLLKTLRTEERGILYETTSDNLRAESLRHQLSEAIQANRYPKEPDRPKLLLDGAIECLEVMRDVIANHRETPGAIPFVDFLARRLPRKAGGESAQSSIIIPGR
jgi:hypothetical protein